MIAGVTNARSTTTTSTTTSRSSCKPRRKPACSTGRSRRCALELSLRDHNTLLESAGFAPAFDEPTLDRGMPAPIERAVDRMLARHEPFPVWVLSRTYDVLRSNHAARRIFGALDEATAAACSG
jgi:hypothetical protein